MYRFCNGYVLVFLILTATIKTAVMKNIISYVKTNDASFSQNPFNRVDALILCWLSYYCYPDYLKGEKSVALKDLESFGLLPDSETYAEAFNPKTSKKLFKLLTQSARFKDTVFSDYAEDRSESEEKQFAALCVKISNDEYFLAFRGTDPSFTGWKEDFNLTCRYPVPSQLAAAEYLNTQVLKFPNGKFYVGGHSKGGNVAVYAAVTASERLQDRIISVYDFDGPGFINGIRSEAGYCGISEKIIKIVPESSFVGMLFETERDFSVIKSRSLSVLQHDPFSWEVKDGDFCYVERRSGTSVRLERALNKWVRELSLDERERVISLIYTALNTLDTRNFNEFFKTFYRQIPALWREYNKLEPDDKTFLGAKAKRLKQLLQGKA